MSVSLAAALALFACGGPTRPEPVDSAQARAFALAALPFAELEIPDDNRPLHAQPATDIPITGWRILGTNNGMTRFEADLPVRPRGLFFHSAQPGLTLVGAEGPLNYEQGVRRPRPYWNHDRDVLTVAFPEPREAPGPDELHLRWPKAVEREQALNFAMSGQPDRERFVRTHVQVGYDSRQGLLLPAPGRMAWDLTLPPAAELHLAPGIVAPEVLDGRPSNGAKLRVEVEVGGTTTTVWSGALSAGTFRQERVDLSRWSGQTVRLRAVSDPSGDADFDYVFLGEPVVASRERNPTTVLLVYVDTLRRDHIGAYGYPRATTPGLDAWAAAHAVTFDQARTIAPWTLPSARTVVTGRQPEEYALAETLQSTLAAQGWATGMIAGNVYLSPNFDMQRGWDYQHVTNWPDADEVTAHALQWLDDHEGRDRLLLVHYMDPHLPYKEPTRYRYAFAGDAPAGFSEKVYLEDIKRLGQKVAPEQRDFVIDRYDNNVKYAVDEAMKVIGRADDNDVVVFFADHGEELWDHRGFEHGHTLFDELLRVPMMVQAPGLAPGRVDAPVSLLDVTPTVLDALGLTGRDLDGQSLLPLARGDAAAAEAFTKRDQAFGRPLYGTPRWGVLHDQQKWTTNEGREALHDLRADPAERDNLAKDDQNLPGATWRGYLADALDRPVDVAFRIFPARPPAEARDQDFVVRVTVPGGIRAAWSGDDPLKGSEVTVAREPVDPLAPEGAATVTFTWLAGWNGTREVYVVPTLPVSEVTQRIQFDVTCGADQRTITLPAPRGSEPGKIRVPLASERVGGRPIAVTWAFAPAPSDDTRELVGADDELKSALEAMGYVEGREEPKPPTRTPDLAP